MKGGSEIDASDRGGRLIAAAPIVALMALALAAGCAPRPTVPEAEVTACFTAYRIVDEAVVRAGVRDAEAHRVPGFPWLRSNRFLASFTERELDLAAWDAWIERLAALDRDGRFVELANLPEADAAAMRGRLHALGAPHDWQTSCPARLQRTSEDAARRQALREAVAVPDDYDALARTLGLYPLSAIPVALGFERWKDAALPAFEVPFGDERLRGRHTLYRPPTGDGPMAAVEVAAVLREAASADPLAIPDPDPAILRRLATTFAPTLLVDVASKADRIGWPVWDTAGRPTVDASRPTAFVRLEHAWVDGRPIAQLVYLFWFDARPREGSIDLLAGRLDGLIWRVSLAADGRPLVYDTIHPCGCYHLFFPAAGTVRLAVPEDDPGDPREAPLVPGSVGAVPSTVPVVVRVASGSHYVTGVAASGEVETGALPSEDYTIVIDAIPDLHLRSMPTPDGGRRSLYGPDGIVPGTERDERVVLWPTGVREPGAMRQWGRHATAFVGERHFDDPRLIDRAFDR